MTLKYSPGIDSAESYPSQTRRIPFTHGGAFASTDGVLPLFTARVPTRIDKILACSQTVSNSGHEFRVLKSASGVDPTSGTPDIVAGPTSGFAAFTPKEIALVQGGPSSSWNPVLDAGDTLYFDPVTAGATFTDFSLMIDVSEALG